MLLTLLILIIILSILVLIHEFGHFITAKKLGIKVEEFGFGFPPKIWGVKKGETVYSINALPFGGFVKLYGEDEAGAGRIGKVSHTEHTKDIKHAFYARPPSQKALVVLAGVIMNTVLAFLIFYIFILISGFKTQMPLLGEHKFFGVNQKNVNLNDHDSVVSLIAPSSPAEKLGMKIPSEIVAVNGMKISDRLEFIKVVNANRGKQIKIAWREYATGATHEAAVIPREHPPKGEGSLGVGFYPVALLSYDTISQKAFSGITYSFNLLSYTFDVLGKLINVSLKTRNVAPVGEGFSGPVGIYKIVEEILKIGNVREVVLGLLNLAGALSISLAFFNVLPIPALDGGRLFFILIELVSGKRISSKYESYAHAIGFAVLVGLLILITYFDIGKILTH